MLRLYVPTLILILITVSAVVVNPILIQHTLEEWSITHLEIETESEYEFEDKSESDKNNSKQVVFMHCVAISKNLFSVVLQVSYYDSPYLSIPEIPPEIS